MICTIKEEEVYLADYVDYWDAYHRIGHFIEDVYQAKCIHSALDYLTPAGFEAAYWARHQRCSIKSRFVWRQFFGHLHLSQIGYRSLFNMAEKVSNRRSTLQYGRIDIQTKMKRC